MNNKIETRAYNITHSLAYEYDISIEQVVDVVGDDVIRIVNKLDRLDFNE